MVELHLRSGQVVAFDGRVLEVFDGGTASGRYHVSQLAEPHAAASRDGVQEIRLPGAGVTLAFAKDEAPGCARLLAAISAARDAFADQGAPKPLAETRR